MLSSAQTEIIKQTVPAVKAHAREITEHFYPLMFQRYPQVLDYFNQAHQEQGTQRQALANAVIAYAANIDRLEVLSDAVSLIVQKHCSLGIQPDHYPIVGECLLESIQTILGDAATPEILDAWGAAYGQLANILIQAEEANYAENQSRAGGWRGEREFRLVRKVNESDVITSFYLEPVEGESAIEFSPGQYIGLVMNIDGQVVRRNYSLSDAPGQKGLRISVKREADGKVSNYLHDQVSEGELLKVSAPCGDFVLNDSQRPLLLVTAGVGLTPAISMLNASVASGRKIHFIHAAQSSKTHAFRDHVDALASRHDNLDTFYIYDQPQAGDTPNATGFIELEHLAQRLPADKDVDLYFLGPKPFMQKVNGLARELALNPDQVHHEFFGPLEALDA